MQLAGLVIISILGSHCLQSLGLAPSTTNTELEQRLMQLLQRIRLEQHYDTLVLYGGAPCVFHRVLQLLQLPQVLLGKGSSERDWNFSNEVLLLSCGAQVEQEQNERTLLKLQRARRLVYLEEGGDSTWEWLCEHYARLEQHNVVVCSAGRFYSCRCFEPHVELHLESNNSSPIYVEQFRNMQGAEVRSEADQLAPRSILYRDAQGKLQMVGFVADLMNTFVQRLNATLQLRDEQELGKVTYFEVLENMTRSNQLDIATCLGATLLAKNFDYLSYPYVMTSYCFMVPLPAPVPYQQIYAIIVEPLVLGLLFLFFLCFSLLLIYTKQLSWQHFSLSQLLLNDLCLRGLLGQSFPWPPHAGRHLKAICCLICFASIMTTTMYNAYLQTYFTHPPAEPTLRSFQDIRESPYKIAVHRDEANLMLKSRNLTVYDATNAYLLDDYNLFIHLRNTFNASYVYPVTELRWRTYAEQQDMFDYPIFYYSDDICLHRFVYLCIPLRRHLPYRHLFEEHMQLMHESGMVDYWLGRSFYDMVIFKDTPIQDYSIPKPLEDALLVRDLTWIFGIYGLGHLAGCLGFAVELFRGRRRRLGTAEVREGRGET